MDDAFCASRIYTNVSPSRVHEFSVFLIRVRARARVRINEYNTRYRLPPPPPQPLPEGTCIIAFFLFFVQFSPFLLPRAEITSVFVREECRELVLFEFNDKAHRGVIIWTD